MKNKNQKLKGANRKTKISKKKKIIDESFPLVAIGASAGGLEAVTMLLQNLSVSTGMAFVYIQHLSPDHKSILSSLLTKATTMKVQEITNEVLILPNNLYVAPPHSDMEVLNGHIKLSPRKKGHVLNLPINTFFSSLAKTRKDRSIGIVLSGSASDGTLGLMAIKTAGGLTFAQDESAKFSSMPKSAIAAGAVDFVLPPKEIALELTRLSKQDYPKHKLNPESEIENGDPDLKFILALLRNQVGVDFSQYKMATIKRRVLRRIMLYKINTIKDYVALLTENKDEIAILYQDLLINVTSFFRDSDTHEYLKSTLFPQILKAKAKGSTLRIWIPACSTGEEAYSIAMILLELKGNQSNGPPVQIFATDLSERAIVKARIGEYSAPELESVSPKQVQRFYTKSGNNFRIAKVVRDMCVFAQHNILHDPPFSHIDFVSCCNLLIYLDNEAQKKVMLIFHYALDAGGYLMLGKSETVGAMRDLFKQVNNRFKIYTNRSKVSTRILPNLSLQILQSTGHKAVLSRPETIKPVPEFNFESRVDDILLSRFMPASVVINQAMEILQFKGATNLYLRNSGRASLNLLKMALPEIAYELRILIMKAIKSKNIVRKTGIELKLNGSLQTITIEAIPLNTDWIGPLLLIVFTEPRIIPSLFPKDNKKDKSLIENKKIKKIEQELLNTRENMQLLMQEHELTNEELQSSIEESVSSNEELRSINEELETSKEEVESANEELVTTNQELQTRNDLLNDSYNYSEAIISTIHEPMIILDKDLRIKSANNSFYKTFLLSEKDTEGTLLYDLADKRWDIPRLRELLEGIIPRNTEFQNFEVIHTFPGIGEKILLLNASRIIQQTRGDQLILLAISDITEHSMLQRKEKELLNREKGLFSKERELLQLDINETKSYSVQLEIAVEERTKDLEQLNKTLESQNKKLEKMNTELEAFAYVSSHDLQEPLRKIKSFALRVLETENQNLSDKGKDYFDRMQAAAGRMQNLIDDLLSFSRLSAADRRFENVDLNTIILEIMTELKDTIEEKHATIVATGLCELEVIPFQFRQLMTNLISNALKFSDPRIPPQITIKSKIEKGIQLKDVRLSAEKKYCQISVADNGIGFDPQYKDRIFNVFQKLHGNHEFAGTGIGLAIVKKAVDNHNGFISVTSKLKQGATFKVFIPVI
jgi:two-component system, chemotaxis family, CheB/CheR fusion protein